MMDAKLAPLFDFGVALVFMRKGSFFVWPVVFLLSCLQFRHSSPCVLPRDFSVLSFVRCFLASQASQEAPGTRGMHPHAWLKLGEKKLPVRVRASASCPRSPVWRPSPAFPVPCPLAQGLRIGRPPASFPSWTAKEGGKAFSPARTGRSCPCAMQRSAVPSGLRCRRQANPGAAPCSAVPSVLRCRQ